MKLQFPGVNTLIRAVLQGYYQDHSAIHNGIATTMVAINKMIASNYAFAEAETSIINKANVFLIKSDLEMNTATLAPETVGKLQKAQTAAELQQHIARCLHREPQLIQARKGTIKTIAWCSGGAQDFIEKAVPHHVDAYLSGEICERTFHLAKELNLDYFAAGHHATERYGIKALGEHLAQQFNLQVEFVDIDNPV